MVRIKIMDYKGEIVFVIRLLDELTRKCRKKGIDPEVLHFVFKDYQKRLKEGIDIYRDDLRDLDDST